MSDIGEKSEREQSHARVDDCKRYNF